MSVDSNIPKDLHPHVRLTHREYREENEHKSDFFREKKTDRR